MKNELSERLLNQCLRNRIMEAVLTLAAGDVGVRDVGSVEYFQSFYDFVPDEADGGIYPNMAINNQEQAALVAVRQIVDAACNATSNILDEEELIETGWPKRIQPIAQNALDLMVRRGRFSEDEEELEPSLRGPWP